MRRRIDFAIVVVKGAIILAAVILAYQWHLALHAWAADLLYIAPQLQFFDALIAIGTLTGCAAVAMLSDRNARRVAINTFIIVGCSMAGLIFGDPSCRGSYDHGGGETEQNCLVFGILGTLIGWALTMMREARTSR